MIVPLRLPALANCPYDLWLFGLFPVRRFIREYLLELVYSSNEGMRIIALTSKLVIALDIVTLDLSIMRLVNPDSPGPYVTTLGMDRFVNHFWALETSTILLFSDRNKQIE